MPTISRFHGLSIVMHYAPREHPPPHFHVHKGDVEAMVLIETGAIHRGFLSTSDLAKIAKWCQTHRVVLLENWRLAMSRSGPLNPIPPLPLP